MVGKDILAHLDAWHDLFLGWLAGAGHDGGRVGFAGLPAELAPAAPLPASTSPST